MFKRGALVGLAAAICLSAASAGAETIKQPRQYTASYNAKRGVYCLRLFSDGQAADPRPNVSGTNCRTKAAWAREGVFVSRQPYGLQAIAH